MPWGKKSKYDDDAHDKNLEKISFVRLTYSMPGKGKVRMNVKGSKAHVQAQINYLKELGCTGIMAKTMSGAVHTYSGASRGQ
jgi:hypothetical protein